MVIYLLILSKHAPGKLSEGLILHPDNEHLIFPLGSTVVCRHIIKRTQTFLRGHNNDVTVI